MPIPTHPVPVENDEDSRKKANLAAFRNTIIVAEVDVVIRFDYNINHTFRDALVEDIRIKGGHADLGKWGRI
jgi:hypothetical protein